VPKGNRNVTGSSTSKDRDETKECAVAARPYGEVVIDGSSAAPPAGRYLLLRVARGSAPGRGPTALGRGVTAACERGLTICGRGRGPIPGRDRGLIGTDRSGIITAAP